MLQQRESTVSRCSRILIKILTSAASGFKFQTRTQNTGAVQRKERRVLGRWPRRVSASPPRRVPPRPTATGSWAGYCFFFSGFVWPLGGEPCFKKDASSRHSSALPLSLGGGSALARARSCCVRCSGHRGSCAAAGRRLERGRRLVVHGMLCRVAWLWRASSASSMRACRGAMVRGYGTGCGCAVLLQARTRACRWSTRRLRWTCMRAARAWLGPCARWQEGGGLGVLRARARACAVLCVLGACVYVRVRANA